MVENIRGKLKLVHLSAYDYGGAGNAAYRLHISLLNMGVISLMFVLDKKTDDPTVRVLPEGSDLLKKTFLHWSNRCLSYPRPSGLELFSDTQTMINLESIAEIRDADVINLHWVAGMIDWDNFPGMTHGKKIVWTLHDMNPFTGGCHYAGSCTKFMDNCGACPQLGSTDEQDLSRHNFFIKSKAYRHLSPIIVSPSKWLTAAAISSTLFSEFSVHTTPYGVPTDIFFPQDRLVIRKSLNIPSDAKVILFGVSYETQRKGFKYLIEAIDSLPPSLSEKLILMSFGPPPGEIGGIRSLHFGNVPNHMHLAQIYSCADAFVIPSLEDNLPNVVLESMACGTPVIGFAAGGIPDMIQHMCNGFLAAVGDVGMLAKGIEWIAMHDNPDQLGEASVATVARRYTLAHQAEAYYRLYLDACSATADAPSVVSTGNRTVFPESNLVHQLLDGLNGLEIGPSTHNPFVLATRNLGIPDEIYEKGQLSLVEETAELDIIARADAIPVPDESEDYIISSHVIEHCPNLVKTLVEWFRIIRRGGYLYMIVPHRDAAPSDRDKPLTDWSHILDDFHKGITELAQPEAGKFGHCHYHVFCPETMKEFITRIFGPRLSLIAFQEHDDKQGSGFTLVYRKEITNDTALPWEFYPALIRVSAIVSTYKSEPFMRACLEDLVAQTLFAKGQLEIVVIDSASPQQEGVVVREFVDRYGDGIVYIRTAERETIYQAWNRGAKAAKGRYLTNANTDDRHRVDALEVMAAELDANPNVALVYADCFVTIFPNETFGKYVRCGYHVRPEFVPEIMLSGCHIGPQPLWRRELHDKIGWFSEELKSAGDYEFWCRIATHYAMKHIPQFLGLYYENPEGFVNSDTNLSMHESEQVRQKYAAAFPVPRKDYSNNFQFFGNLEKNKYVNICIITNNNQSSFIRTLESLLRYTEYPHKITVADNGSSAEMVALLTSCKDRGIISNLLLFSEPVVVSDAIDAALSMEPEVIYRVVLGSAIIVSMPGWLTVVIKEAARSLSNNILTNRIWTRDGEIKNVHGFVPAFIKEAYTDTSFWLELCQKAS